MEINVRLKDVSNCVINHLGKNKRVGSSKYKYMHI